MLRTRYKAGGQRRCLPTLVLGATLVLALCAFTTPAGAAVIGVTSKCFVNSNPDKGAQVSVIGSGFNAGDQIMISGGTKPVTTVAASDGTIAAIIPGPVLTTSGPTQHIYTGPGEQTYTLTAQDETDTVTAATTTVTMANLSVDTVPSQGIPPSRPVTWQLSGFAPGRTIWVHYFYRHRVVTQMQLGRATGACGMLTSKHLLFPGGHPRTVTYGVVIDQSKRYRKSTRPRIVTSLSFKVQTT